MKLFAVFLEQPVKRGWATRLSDALSLLGGPGIFLLALLDSSVLSFPVVTDLLIMEQAMRSPKGMPYLVAMAVAGSLVGCLWLYWLAKKGGEAYYRRRAGGGPGRLKNWMQRHAFASVFGASLLPPPIPFKPFVLAAGVLQVSPRSFALAVFSGRSVRYLLEGWLAIRYGPRATNFLLAHKLAFGLIILAAMLVGMPLSRWLSRTPESAHET